MRSSLLALMLAFALLPPVVAESRADDGAKPDPEKKPDAQPEGKKKKDDEEPPTRAEVARGWLEQLKDHELHVDVGPIGVDVVVVPDHFHVLAARAIAGADPARTPDSLRKQLADLAARQKRSVLRPALLVKVARLEAASGGDQLAAFEGQLHEHFRLTQAGAAAVPLTPVSGEGAIRQRELKLFKAQRSPVFPTNSPPTLTNSYGTLEGTATYELVARKALSPKAKALKLQVAAILWFRGLQGDQLDFERGGSATSESGQLEVTLPLRIAPIPREVAELLPTVTDDD
jgi:hypothetical protein